MSLTEAAIVKLLTEYVNLPLMRLREINQQAELSNLLLRELVDAEESIFTTVVISNCGTGRIRAVHSDTPTQRVQQELKVSASVSPGKDRSDIVLLKSGPNPVHFKRARNGSLDVVAGVALKYVDSIVEIKAACSAAHEQRHLFRQDVVKLLKLVREAPPGQSIEAHFILIDKSLPVGPHTLDFGPSPILNWESGHPGALRIRKNIKQQSNIVLEPSPQLILNDSPPVDERYVNVWDLDANLSIRHRICYMFDSPSNEQAKKLGILSKAKMPPDKEGTGALD